MVLILIFEMDEIFLVRLDFIFYKKSRFFYCEFSISFSFINGLEKLKII